MGEMKAALVTVLSVALSALVVGNAYYQKKQFYPSVVYITKSNTSMAVIYLQAFVILMLVCVLFKKIFFGQLRAIEIEHLMDRTWFALTETCLAFTVFRDDFSPKFVSLFTLLMLLKAFHWLTDDRVDYMERSPLITLLFHIRIISLLGLLFICDAVFFLHAYNSTTAKGPSVQIVFGFEYAILFTVALNVAIKYLLHTIDSQTLNPWDNKAGYLLYTELIMGLLQMILYLIFLLIMIKIHTFPFFALRPMYQTAKSLKKSFNDVVRSRRAIRNMNTLYPDATPAELLAGDSVCIICREEMSTGAKKLPCNHIFHISCLRSWFQRQQTCPTCRMNILRTTSLPRQQQQTPQPQQMQNPQANGPVNPMGNGALPPGLWLPFQQFPLQAPIPPLRQEAGTSSSAPPGSSSSSSERQSSVGAGEGATSLPPLFSFPSMPFMPYGVPAPPPMPLPDLTRLSDEELRAMEGRERAHLEARIKCLKNIQLLLDAAMMQMSQYSMVSSTIDRLPSNPEEPKPSTSHDPGNKVAADDGSTTIPSTIHPEADLTEAASSSNDDPSDSTHADDPESKEKEELRRRRLQKFVPQT